MSITSQLKLCDVPSNNSNILIIGRKSRLEASELGTTLGLTKTSWNAMLKSIKAKDNARTTSTWVGAKKVALAMLPESCSRHNSPSRAWAITAACQSVVGPGKWSIIALIDSQNATATTAAIAKAFNTFSAKSSATTQRTIEIVLTGEDGVIMDSKLDVLMSGVQYAASLFDRPTSSLNVSDFVTEAETLTEIEGVSLEVIRGNELKEGGFGGFWGVGKAAQDPPALVCLRWTPRPNKARVAWVGKGIVYDTGGLSLKSKTGMPGMKGDMGGAAAVLGAFRVAVHQQAPFNISAILCLAENAIGPDATRPDDVLTMYSGKTVEINNTDAEGRLVLADGVAWCAENEKPDCIIDIATLTGAAPTSVGKSLAALYCNNEELERLAVVAGRECGELCHPLPYLPEFFRHEFSSSIADMKNSVKNRANGQSACAGQFVGNHLTDQSIRWLHIDIAGPAWGQKKRGSGFGVTLLNQISHDLYGDQ